MTRKRFLMYIFILVLSISFVGCAGIQRKFTRKKKKEEVPAPVITTYDYKKDLRVSELYKKHFLYWKTWQDELIERIDEGYKKRIECYDNLVMHLMEFGKYLVDSKTKELEPFIKKIKSIDPDIRKKRLSKSEENKMRNLLEKSRRQIDRGFSYPKVKDFLELNK
jgi:hypothetical protein